MSGCFAERIEILPGQLYFCCKDDNKALETSQKYIYFSTDNTLQYTAFFADFGPLNIGLTYNFCEQLDTLLTQSSVERKPVIYYSSTHPHKRANAAVLLCAYLIFVKELTVEQAYAPFIGITPMLTTFRDAAFCINTYPVTVLDCTRAFYRAHCLKHFVYSTFDVHKHDHLAKLENGDVSWIIPGKFVAFSGPTSAPRELSPGVFALSPEGYVPLFKSLGVTCIVRFNKKCYDRNIFVRAGIRHVDLYYEDGGNPSDSILQAFLTTCEKEKGAIAVHCKAGLGRTGTNIAAYMMKHYGYSARESTAWCRVCRPGSVVGPQQQYLETIQERMWEEGRIYRNEARGTKGDNGSALPSTGKTSQTHIRRKSSGSARSSAETVESSLTARLLRNHQRQAHRTNDGESAVRATASGRARSEDFLKRPNTSGGASGDISNSRNSGGEHARQKLVVEERPKTSSRAASGKISTESSSHLPSASNGSRDKKSSTTGGLWASRTHSPSGIKANSTSLSRRNIVRKNSSSGSAKRPANKYV